jgi:putative transposase
MIAGGAHAFKCIRYIDLNVVRAGAVGHPEQWKWCSYDELTGRRKRYRPLDRQAVMHWLGHRDVDMLVKEYESSVALAIQAGELKRLVLRWDVAGPWSSRALLPCVLDHDFWIHVLLGDW